MKKVCFFVTSLNSGGIENYLLRFLKHYPESFDVTVFCKSGYLGELEEEFRKLERIKIVKRNLGYVNISAYLRLLKYLKKEQIDTVCDFTGNFAGQTLFAAKMARIKNRIAFYRGSTNRFKETKLNLLYNWFVRFLVLNSATEILSNSKFAFANLFNNQDSRFKVIYNGLNLDFINYESESTDLRSEIEIPQSAFIIGHTGRVHYSKNHATIIDVANILCSKYDDIHFVLAGKNTDTELTSLVDEEISNRIHLLGYRSDVSKVLRSFDMYFFPSITEGQPNSLIEAMFFGLPIVASDIEPIRESIPEEFHQYLIPIKSIVGFVEKLEELYLYRRTSEFVKLREWAKEAFDANKQFEKFYTELNR